MTLQSAPAAQTEIEALEKAYIVHPRHREEGPGASICLIPSMLAGGGPAVHPHASPEERIASLPHLFLDECFELGEQIGEGGMGKVYRARQLDLGRDVAIKKSKSDREIVDTFLKEAFTSACLDHPNIVPVHLLGRTGGAADGEQRSVFIAMRRIEGTTWERRIAEDWKEGNPIGNPVYLTQHLGILLEVMRAVEFAHDKGIIHRDLKPEQVMIGRYGEVYLLDWGLAMYLGDGEAAVSPLPRNENADDRLFTRRSATNPAGTPCYMAPEQTDATTERLGVHTDIYLLGGILHRLLSGHPPRQFDNIMETVVAARHNCIDPLPDGVPPILEQLTFRCLQADPLDRPSRVREVREQLEAFLSGRQRITESRGITDALETAPLIKDYAEAFRRLGALERARGLWPGNEAVVRLLDRERAAVVQMAIHSEDIRLAGIFAEHIHDPATHRRLLEDVGRAQTRLRLHRIHGRILRWFMGVLLLGIVASGLLASHTLQHARESNEHIVELSSLRGEILRLDEVLTSSARLAATTGDRQWEERYRDADSRLRRAINRALSLSKGEAASILEQTVAANERLVAMENQAFREIEAGQLAAASSLLENAEYLKDKHVYFDSMSHFIETVHEELHAESHRQESALLVTQSVFALMLVIFAAISLVTRLGNRRRRR